MENPNKVANCFLWTNDLNSILDTLKLLKDNDIDFHKKFRVVNGDYEKQGDRERIEVTRKENSEIEEYVRVKCKVKLSWEDQKNILFKFCEKFQRVPKRKETCGEWFNHQKIKITSIEDDIYKKLSQDIFTKQSLDKYLQDKKKAITDYTKYLFDFIELKARVPTRNDGKIGPWYDRIRREILLKKNHLVLSKYFEEIIKNSCVEKDFDNYKKELTKKENILEMNKMELFINLVKKNNEIPNSRSKYIDDKKIETKIGQWYCDMKRKMYKNKDNNHFYNDIYKGLIQHDLIKKRSGKVL